MHRFTVSAIREIEADTAEEAALLMFQELTKGQLPIDFSVADETQARIAVKLDREKAEEFANADHTADPGNW